MEEMQDKILDLINHVKEGVIVTRNDKSLSADQVLDRMELLIVIMNHAELALDAISNYEEETS